MRKTVLLLLLILSGSSFAITTHVTRTLKSDNKTELTVTGSRPLLGSLDFAGYNLNNGGSINASDVNTQRLSGFTSNGIIRTSDSNGTLIIDPNSYLTAETDPCFVDYLSLHPYNDANWNTAYGYLNQGVKTTDSPTFAGLTLSSHVDNALLYTDSSGVASSSANLTFDGTNLICLGSVGIGTSTLTGKFNTANSANYNLFYADTYSTTAAHTNTFTYRRSHHNTLGTLATTLTGDEFGYLSFLGVSSGNAWALGAAMTAKQDGTAGATYIPTNFIFQTSSATGLNNTHLVLHNDGKTGMGTDAPLSQLQIYANLGTPTDLGNFNSYHLVLQGGTSTGNGTGILFSSSSDTYGGSAIVHYDKGAAGIGDLVFYTKQVDSDVPPTAVMKLDYLGNTLINGSLRIGSDVVPTVALDVTGAGNFTTDVNAATYHAAGATGIDATVYTVDSNSTLHILTFTKGILTGVSP